MTRVHRGGFPCRCAGLPVRCRRRRRERRAGRRPAPFPIAGFSLVEVLVSFALLGLTASTVLALVLRSGLNNLEARRADALAAMARSSLADIEAGRDLDQVWCPAAAAWRDDCAGESPRYRRVVRSVVTLAPVRPGESVEVTEVTLEVTALQAGRAAGERTITLVSLRVP